MGHDPEKVGEFDTDKEARIATKVHEAMYPTPILVLIPHQWLYQTLATILDVYGIAEAETVADELMGPLWDCLKTMQMDPKKGKICGP